MFHFNPRLQADVAETKEALEGDLDLDDELREQSQPLVLPVGRTSVVKVPRTLPTRSSYVEMADQQPEGGSSMP